MKGIATSTHTDGIQLTWKFSGDPQLGQATFSFRSPNFVFNAKFDGTRLIGFSLSDFAMSKNRYVELDYSYDIDNFSVFIPHEVLDLECVEVEFGLAVNSVRRGEMSFVL